MTTDWLMQNLFAAVVVPAVVTVAGLPMALLLPRRIGRRDLGFALLPLGTVYWACALYVAQYAGGLDAALAAAAVGSAVLLVRRPAALFPKVRLSRSTRRAGGVIAVGCLCYVTPLAWQPAPTGMDASMYVAAARLMAAENGVPASHAPFAAEVFFPALNMGMPTIAAVAVRLGVAPEAATIAVSVLTYALILCGCHLMVRPWTPAIGAAVVAVVSAALASGVQQLPSWGGAPTGAGLALGLFAARLMVEAARRPTVASAMLLGFVAAALPLVHAVAAALWLYTVAPAAVLVGVRRVDWVRRSGWRRLAGGGVVAGATAVAVLAVYLAVGKPRLSG
ncbi:MAG: hypothetical protein ACRC1K_20355, partial [Planctomycetia bacterium]